MTRQSRSMDASASARRSMRRAFSPVSARRRDWDSASRDVGAGAEEGKGDERAEKKEEVGADDREGVGGVVALRATPHTSAPATRPTRRAGKRDARSREATLEMGGRRRLRLPLGSSWCFSPPAASGTAGRSSDTPSSTPAMALACAAPSMMPDETRVLMCAHGEARPPRQTRARAAFSDEPKGSDGTQWQFCESHIEVEAFSTSTRRPRPAVRLATRRARQSDARARRGVLSAPGVDVARARRPCERARVAGRVESREASLGGERGAMASRGRPRGRGVRLLVDAPSPARARGLLEDAVHAG